MPLRHGFFAYTEVYSNKMSVGRIDSIVQIKCIRSIEMHHEV
jgi:hypothetical protein